MLAKRMLSAELSHHLADEGERSKLGRSHFHCVDSYLGALHRVAVQLPAYRNASSTTANAGDVWRLLG